MLSVEQTTSVYSVYKFRIHSMTRTYVKLISSYSPALSDHAFFTLAPSDKPKQGNIFQQTLFSNSCQKINKRAEMNRLFTDMIVRLLNG